MVDAIAEQFSLVIVSPDEVMFEGDVVKLLVPGTEQQLAILPDHTPLYAILLAGTIEVTDTTGTVQMIAIDGGILRSRVNSVTIITGFDIGEDEVLTSTKAVEPKVATG